MNFQALVWKDRGPRGHIIFLACLCMFKNCLTYKYLLSSFLLHCALHSLWICPYLSFFILHDGAPGSVRIDLFNVPHVLLLPVQLKMATVCRTTKNQTKPNQNKTNLVILFFMWGLFLCILSSQCQWIDPKIKMEGIFLYGLCSTLRVYFSLKLEFGHKTCQIVSCYTEK